MVNDAQEAIETAVLRIRYGIDLDLVYNGYFADGSKAERTQEILKLISEYKHTELSRKDAQALIKNLRQNYRMEIALNQSTTILKGFINTLELELSRRLAKYQGKL
ncbi:hypothetical protein [Floridanema aerugineum]|uniref:Uncharacterized protein n=1 Tax=Floridaenema aerugineum BLCC-F46 TaxID=3153654 RepID=A0ABV4X282_9CYAN